MKYTVPMLGVLLAVASCGRGPDDAAPAPGVTITNAVVALPAVPSAPGAAYFILTSGSDPARLVGIASPAIQRAELHGTMSHGHMSAMAPLQPADLAFAPGAPLVFAPGGKHAMLFGVDRALRPGGKVRLIFTFDAAPPVTVEADVVGPGQAGTGAGH
jgi:hypothetical protein